MPMLVGFLVMIAAVYQLFFRFERWSNTEKPGVMYEHDSLTGETHILQPGAKTNVFARILGSGSDRGHGMIEAFGTNRSNFVEPATDLIEETTASDSFSPRGDNTERPLNLQDVQQVEKAARPIPTPREIVVASSAPPVPNSVSETENLTGPFAVRQVDLNRDGSKEEVIQNALKHDGLLDISIVKDGREIFYGRGQQIGLLPTRNRNGWSDIVLKSSGKVINVFRYDFKTASYKPFNGSNG